MSRDEIIALAEELNKKREIRKKYTESDGRFQQIQRFQRVERIAMLEERGKND